MSGKARYGDEIPEPWSVRDDRPYVRSERRSAEWLVPGVAILLIVAVAAGIAWWQLGKPLLGFGSEPEPAPAPQASAEALPPAAPAPPPTPVAEPEVTHPLPEEAPKAPAKALPTLQMSDSEARGTLAGLFGREAFSALFQPVDLVRRIVASVDNLPREAVAQRTMPLKPARGRFAVTGGGEELVLDAKNFARYDPYVKAFAAVDATALVAAYVHAYPLFQQAYRELGYPKGHFNDRLLAAIDDLLAAPEVAAPIKLMRPKVLYEFADPDLQTRSAGQKAMIRMGSENAARVKAKLRELRREIIAASEARRQ
ncbi:MAG TPA: DUF3014 domain-containing protein [Burkholderiales bacterium]|nr:DUF3014 domain-containing protein [Burkholderiales bacterium]